MYIPIDHVQVEASDMATEQELAEAISACFEGFVQPEYIRFESIEKL
jgi:hypothetical protein